MSKNYTAPAAFDSADKYLPIPMTAVSSNQVAAIGYDAATKTLAVTFTRGLGSVYQYPDVEPDLHAAFISAESIGRFFGQHIKTRPFRKFAAEVALPA